MIDFKYIKDITQSTQTKIIMLVVDGLGGLPNSKTGKSELETAKTPNLDDLAKESECGLTTPVEPGITPGSGPGHMSLFGYNPVKYLIGRGVLEALGIDIKLQKNDIAARGNLCTVDSEGILIDRRAGRIPTEESASIIKLLNEIEEIPPLKFTVYPVRDHRFVLVMKGNGLQDQVTETDPQQIGVLPLKAESLSKQAEPTAKAVNNFVNSISSVLKSRSTANMVLLRGFSSLPNLPDFGETYRLKPIAIASYPMYRGLARLVGMKILKTGLTFDDQIKSLQANFKNSNFFFIHYKPTDAAGEDGNFEAKVAALEELDHQIPNLINLGADALVISGDHSTPAVMSNHSWHPVPLLIHSRTSTMRTGPNSGFSESSFASGSIGHIHATSVMMLALAHAGKLKKFGP